ncbi:Mechanosensitive ion channel protein 10 [Zancudomyces culisetae]|uniref:Mechanosensitive ion channel protein 10 n=1 Tax=Zancudomyces culisetae TaxID=1213189 RepID=A0A1R1PTX0_ZANCU|nr:Mechanosensitive ion channel protein 10 [Zancudomyces culisetae]|eukprot:OMH84342.1 Mechanosensitive ion channel protein 10 [Zancudomyces culisetae]
MIHIYSSNLGDYIIIGDENMIVVKIRLLTTIFRKTDGRYVIYPNTLLAGRDIVNIRRSGGIWEGIEFDVDFDTPHTTITELHARVSKYASVLTHRFTSGWGTRLEPTGRPGPPDGESRIILPQN